METIETVEVVCERCDGKGCGYCFGQPEVVRVRNARRLCEWPGDEAGSECPGQATYRLEFTCVELFAEPMKCVIHVCGWHRANAKQAMEGEQLDSFIHRDTGFPVVGGIPFVPMPETMGCPACAVEAGMDHVEAWEMTFTDRGSLPQRIILRSTVAFGSDATMAHILDCGHTTI